MSNRVQIVDDLKNALSARFKDLHVDAFPDRPEAYVTHPKGALLVSYVGGRYGEPFSEDLVAQEALEQFGITVQFRQLNGRSGAIGLVDEVAGFVTGLELSEGTRVHLMRVEFVRQATGLWEYLVIVATRTVQMESRDIASAPPVTRVAVEYDELLPV